MPSEKEKTDKKKDTLETLKKDAKKGLKNFSVDEQFQIL